MFSHIFLAKTKQEMTENPSGKTSYLSCRFSPYGKGLTNLPNTLPPDSLLLLDDSMPPGGHDAQLVINQLKEIVSRFSVNGVLLDFQNERSEASERMVKEILQSLPCPVAATAAYAKRFHCPVFLPPSPVNMPLCTYLKPWGGRDIYLEVAPVCTRATITPEGSHFQSLHKTYAPLPHADHRLHCHYRVDLSPDKAAITMMRTGEDLSALAKEALDIGVSALIGLFQELKQP